MTNTLSVIFPLYNEEKRLHFTFKDILRFNKRNIFSKVEYLFIDDGSTDKSSLKIHKFIKSNKRKNTADTKKPRCLQNDKFHWRHSIYR